MAVNAVGVGRVRGVAGGVGAGVGEVALAVGVAGEANAVDLRLSRGFGLKTFVAVGFSGFFATSVPPAVDVPPAVPGELADAASVDGELFAPAELVPDFVG